MKHLILAIFSCLFLPNLAAQTHTITVHSNGRAASLLMSTTEYTSWLSNDDFNKAAVLKPLIKDIYKKFDDDFDYIFLMLNESTRPTTIDYFGQLISVSNSISGIGLPISNRASEYGSKGKLKSVIHLPALEFLINGPSLHELAHNWANFGIKTEAVFKFGTGLTSFDFTGHWGFTGGSTKGQLGGFEQSELVNNSGNNYTIPSFGEFANGGNSLPYNKLELYLMGLIPASDVPSFDVFKTITSHTDNKNNTVSFTASGKTTYTPTSLVSTLGTRNPLHTTSPKNFKALVIVLTKNPLTTAEWQTIDTHVELFSRNASDNIASIYNFWEATNQLATIEMDNLSSSVLSTDSYSLKNQINIYPNPIRKNELLTIQLNPSDFGALESITIFDVLGKNMWVSYTKNEASKIRVDLNNLPQGVYFMQLKMKNSTKFIRKKIFIKE